jgi:cupin fold WbuC family metalloprotein
MANVNAFDNVSGDTFRLTQEILQQGFAGARESPRRRIILPIHRDQNAEVQRMLNFLQPGTILQPHLHPLPHASETICVLRGVLGFIVFDSEGVVIETHRLDAAEGLATIDIEPNVWHGMTVLAEDTVMLEIKKGPYDPANDKVFATWAPTETDPDAATYDQKLQALFLK